MAERKREVIRLHLELVQTMLAPLKEKDRTEVLVELAIVEAIELQKVSKQLDEAREETEAWRRHNEQRLEEVSEARALLGAKPNETLPMAIERYRGSDV